MAEEKKITLTMEELEALIASKVAEKVAEAVSIAPAAAPETPVQRTARNEWLEEYVEVRLFKDEHNYKDDVYVSVNGENCLVRRGAPVRIKRKFALVLEQSQQQDIDRADFLAMLGKAQEISTGK